MDLSSSICIDELMGHDSLWSFFFFNVSALIFPYSSLVLEDKAESKRGSQQLWRLHVKSLRICRGLVKSLLVPENLNSHGKQGQIREQTYLRKKGNYHPPPIQLGFRLYSVNFPPLKKSSPSHGINASIFHWRRKKVSGFAWVDNLSEELMNLFRLLC